jgi:hypothetical protein
MNLEQRMEELERKLARSERRNRFLLVGVMIAVAVGFLGFVQNSGVAQAGVQKSISAESFNLVDKKGGIRGTFTISNNEESPMLLLIGKEKEGVIMLGMIDGLPELTFCDREKKVRARFDLNNKGPKLTLYDENKKIRVGIAVLEKDGPTILLTDPQERTRVALSFMDDTSTLRMIDDKGNTRTFLFANKDAGVFISDAKGEPVWGAP